MQYALQRAEGFVLITGTPGTGKTTLIKEIVDELKDSSIKIAKVVSSQVSANDLLRLISYSLGVDSENKDKATLIRHLELYFVEQLRHQQRTLLIVDEAQALPKHALEELRLLTNLEYNDKPLLQVFLVGQPQLLNIVRLDVMEQLRQRIIAASILHPLKSDQIEAYVMHRLRIAGWQQDPVLDSSVFPFLYHFSQGIPRRINQICSRLLLHGYVEGKHALDGNDATAVIEELRSEQLNISPWTSQQNGKNSNHNPHLAVIKNHAP